VPRDAQFVMVRHYSWRTPPCSKKCVDRFRTRRESDRNWVSWLQTAFDQRGLYDGPDLNIPCLVVRDSTDFAPRRQNHDRLSVRGCRGLPAASWESRC